MHASLRSIGQFILWVSLFASTSSFANNERIKLFPIEHYDQDISHWIVDNKDADKPLISAEEQQHRFTIFKDHYFGERSPWHPSFIQKLLRQAPPNDIKSLEALLLTHFNNKNKPGDKIGYGENFRAHDEAWINHLEENMQVSQLQTDSYQAAQRAIATTNLHARILPTDDPFFYHHQLAGEGYPFDNLQVSSIWSGTPLYILGETKDKAWSLVVTPEFIGWAHSDGIAYVNADFIDQWTQAAQRMLIAINKTQLPINVDGTHLFSAYIGSVFPGEKTFTGVRLLVPIKQGKYASLGYAEVNRDQITVMPLPLTKRNLTNVIKLLISRPYGWGNMYFYNDCSAEMKSLFTAFGLWLPRHSSDQLTEGRQIDLSTSSSDERLKGLRANGVPMLTLIYIGGHVLLYMGEYQSPDTHQPVLLSYQNMWGLRPSTNDSRSVIGRSVLLPLLPSYPEDTSLVPLSSRSLFQISNLDEIPATTMANQVVNLKKFMQIPN